MELTYDELKCLNDSEILLQKVDEILSFLRDRCVKAEIHDRMFPNGDTLDFSLSLILAIK
jgi:hypothetical protein